MRLLAVTVMVGLLLAGCGSEKKADDTAATYSDDQLVAQASQKLIGEFGRELKSELMTAMKAGGAVNALEVCKVRAPEIAAAHTAGGVWSIARVTDRYRNLDNKATEAQMTILARFADTTQPGNTFAQWKVDSLGDSSYCFYQAIRTGDLCLNCHGPVDKLAPGVKEKLAELYPDDLATGYASGDLRGMFVVTMKWPAAKQAAEDLVKTPETNQEAR